MAAHQINSSNLLDTIFYLGGAIVEIHSFFFLVDPLLKTMSKFFWMCSDTALNIASSLEALSRRSAISWMVKGVTPEVLGVWVQLVRVGARQYGCGSFLGLTVTDHVQR